MYLYKANPFYKCVTVILCAVALSFTYSVMLNTAVFCVSILLIITGSDKIITALKFTLAVSLPAAGYLITGLYFGTNQETGMASIAVSSLDTGLNLATRMFAFAGLGMVFSLTTNPYHFVESLQKDAKLKRKFAYGILCAFNLLPHIKNEFQNARLALQVRGATVSPFSLKPLFSTLVNSIKWSETLSIAMQSKGFHED